MHITRNCLDVAVLGAVEKEMKGFFEFLDPIDSFSFRGEEFIIRSFHAGQVLFGTTGIGKVNAAITTAALLERWSIGQVWNIGCSGAYSEGPLRIGDVLITLQAFCGDEGILTAGGIHSMKEIGIPVLRHNGEDIYDQIPLVASSLPRFLQENLPGGFYQLNEDALKAMERRSSPEATRLDAHPGTEGSPTHGLTFSQISPFLLSEAGESESAFRILYGPSLTVGMASGDPQTARERYRLHGAFAENMEGSAIAQACFRFGTPVIECRGVSNMAGVRDKSLWGMEKAIAHCHCVILHLLATLLM